MSIVIQKQLILDYPLVNQSAKIVIPGTTKATVPPLTPKPTRFFFLEIRIGVCLGVKGGTVALVVPGYTKYV